jgi:hypothetical protein
MLMAYHQRKHTIPRSIRTCAGSSAALVSVGRYCKLIQSGDAATPTISMSRNGAGRENDQPNALLRVWLQHQAAQP